MAEALPTCGYCGKPMTVERRYDGTEHRRWCSNDKCDGNVGVFGDGARVVAEKTEKK